MLFHEIYGAYFHTVAVILTEAVNGTLSAKRLTDIVAREAFGESLLSIPAALQNGKPFVRNKALGRVEVKHCDNHSGQV